MGNLDSPMSWGEHHVNMKADVGVTHLQSRNVKNISKPSETRAKHRIDSSSQLSEVTNSANHLDIRFLAPRTMRQYISIV